MPIQPPIAVPGYTEGVEDGLLSGTNQAKSQLQFVGGNRVPSVQETDGPIPPEIADEGGGGGGGGGSADDAEWVPGAISTEVSPGFDSWPSFNAAWNPTTGTFPVAGKPRSKMKLGGTYLINGLLVNHPQTSFVNDARGAVVLRPGSNLAEEPGQASGDSAFIKQARLTPLIAGSLAWAPVMRGVNIDWRQSTQIHSIWTMRNPDPDPGTNPIDPDPHFTTNKDYVAGVIEHCDWVGGSAGGWKCEQGNGRAEILSSRCIGFDDEGWLLLGNDIVMHGHWAAGGNGGGVNGGFGVTAGAAAGFLAVTGNIWGNPGTRSAATGAMWMNGRRSYAVGFCVINDFIRMDGSSNYWHGGTFALNSHATHDENFVSDGVAININNDHDLRCQTYYAISQYRTSDLIANRLGRTTPVPFATPRNVGGSQDGSHGTAYRLKVDASGGAAVNIIDTDNSEPNCKAWVGPDVGAFTIISPPTNQINIPGNGLRVGSRISFVTTGTLPTPLAQGITYFIVGEPDSDDIKVSRAPGGSPISITDIGSGTHTIVNQSQHGYGTRSLSTVNFLNMDSGSPLIRLGAAGTGNPGHFQACLADSSEGQWEANVGDFTLHYNTNSTDYTLHAVAHGMKDNDQVTLTVSAGGTLPGGLVTTQQYSVINAQTDSFQLADAPQQNIIPVTNTAGSGTASFWSWTLKYTVEMGNTTRHNGAPDHNAIYGVFEAERVIATQAGTWSRNTPTSGLGPIVLDPYEPFRHIFADSGHIATLSLTLPMAMTASYTTVLYLKGDIDAITWVGTVSTTSPPLPVQVRNLCILTLQYQDDVNEWFVQDIFSTSKRIMSLGVSGVLAGDGNLAQNFVIGPLTNGCTIDNVANPKDGVEYCWRVVQDGTGGRAVNWGPKFVKPATAFTTTANGITLVKAIYDQTANKFYVTSMVPGEA